MKPAPVGCPNINLQIRNDNLAAVDLDSKLGYQTGGVPTTRWCRGRCA